MEQKGEREVPVRLARRVALSFHLTLNVERDVGRWTFLISHRITERQSPMRAFYRCRAVGYSPGILQ